MRELGGRVEVGHQPHISSSHRDRHPLGSIETENVDSRVPGGYLSIENPFRDRNPLRRPDEEEGRGVDQMVDPKDVIRLLGRGRRR